MLQASSTELLSMFRCCACRFSRAPASGLAGRKVLPAAARRGPVPSTAGGRGTASSVSRAPRARVCLSWRRVPGHSGPERGTHASSAAPPPPSFTQATGEEPAGRAARRRRKQERPVWLSPAPLLLPFPTRLRPDPPKRAAHPRVPTRDESKASHDAGRANGAHTHRRVRARPPLCPRIYTPIPARVQRC